MSLIVARHVAGEIFFVGDTKFTTSDEVVTSGAQSFIGGLKVVILNPGICVAFAGEVLYAQNAIQGIYDGNVNFFDQDIAIDHFLRNHVDSVTNGTPTDFIVASITAVVESPGQYRKELFKISNGTVEPVTQVAWIGDHDAFNEYQRASLDPATLANIPGAEIARLGTVARPEFDASLSTSMKAMQHVIDSHLYPSVDGIRTMVVAEGEQFRYVEYVLIRGQPIPVSNAPGAPVHFGEAAEGSAAWHAGLYGAAGHGIFPVYSYTGKFGIIYQPELNLTPAIHRNITLEDFKTAAKAQLDTAHERAAAHQTRVTSD